MARRHRTKEREISTASRGAATSSVRIAAPTPDTFRHLLLGAAAALLVARPLVPSDGDAWLGDGQIGSALWISLAMLWLLRSLGRPRLEIRFGWIDAAVVAFVGWWSVAALMGAAHAAPRPSINRLWEGVAFLLTFLLLRQLIEPGPTAFEESQTASNRESTDTASRGGREARALVAVMIAVGVTLAIVAIHEYFVTKPAERKAFVANPAAMFREADVEVAAPGTLEFRRFADRLNSPEPTATFSLTNSLAAFLAPWLVIAIGTAMLGDDCLPSWLRGRWRWLRIAGFALPIASALALTHSRSACIGAVVGFGCLLIWRFSAQVRAHWRLLATIVLLVAVAGGTVIAIRPQLLQLAVHSFRVRVDYWRATSAMIADRPWFGCGPGNFGDYYTEYKLPAATEEVKDPHNFALEIASSAGLPALILFLVILAGFAVRVRRSSVPDSLGLASPVDTATPADGAHWILGGAIVGFWMALFWNRYAGFPPREEIAAIGTVAAGVVWWLLGPWIRAGTLPPRLCGIGVLVLLVALLALGGIAFGGVNETLWLLLALGLNAADAAALPAKPKTSLPWGVNIVLLPIVIGIWFAQRQTAYEPVLGCEAALEAAREYGEQRDQPKQERQLLAAAAADPYAVEPRRILARLRLGEWLRANEGGPRGGASHGSVLSIKLIAGYEKWMNQAIALEPQSAALRAQAGGGWWQVYLRTKIAADGRKAVEFFRSAAALYPTGIVVQFQLAQVLSSMGDAAGAKVAASEALRLDDLRPEAERALGDEQRKLAERIILGDNERR